MSQLVLLYPWLLALLPLPLLVWRLVPPYSRPRGALLVPFLPRLAALVGRQPDAGVAVSRRGWLGATVLCLCWLCALLALARPQVIEPPVSKSVPVRDLLLAVDLSGSMGTRDFTDADGAVSDRLTAVKEVLDGFLARREGDRVGLIFFGSAAFVQVPFTEDLDVCRQLLDEAQVRMAGPQTAFGDALGLAINVFERSEVEQRVLIALTDGNDTNSQVPPDKAAQIARDKGIVIHTVAVGDPRAAGEEALDEAMLQRVATTTGGSFSHAGDRAELEAVYAQLDALETRQAQSVSQRPRRDVFWWPLALALLLSMGYLGGVLLREQLASRAAPPLGSLAALAPAGLVLALQAFHFLRPAWWLALLPAALLYLLLRRRADSARVWRGLVAPHLLAYLWAEQGAARCSGPLQWVAAIWLLAILAIAGPSWRHQPSPFAEDTAALAVVIRVAPTMLTEDIQPSRLARAVQKLHDLLQARGTGSTALVAYAGSAHLVMPATRDAGIIENFAAALTPGIMPVDGDAAAQALALAQQSLDSAGGGSILWITDSVAPQQSAALADWRRGSQAPVSLWPPLMPGPELDALRKTAGAADVRLQRWSADDADVQSLARAARFADAAATGEGARWADAGYWLTPLIALLVLALFRRGAMVPRGSGA
ncbi:VWA domain-containing protein [Mangrovimicrobium sediminis]|uniref:VWA domain-containing protein n=1 Tax=Mangrovimicrobium sediminis TaxID=2562682 RepID=UPI001436CB2A|nr:VWA domain-containing protein [Haliea sp. SAOS-164]